MRPLHGSGLHPWRRGLAVAAAAAVAAAGCGGFHATTAGPAAETADQSLAAAAAAFAQLTSFHLQVSSAKSRLSLDAHAGAEHGFQTVVQSAQTTVTFEYIVAGHQVYFHGLSFLRLRGLAAKYPQVGSNWYLATDGDGSAGLDTFTDPAKAAHCLVERHGPLAFGAPATVGTTAAVTIVAAGGGPGTAPETYYVSADGHHTLLRIVQTGATVGDPADTCESFGADPQRTGPQVTIDVTQQNQVAAIAAPVTSIHVP